MRYQRLADIVRLATRLQGTSAGLTLAEIAEEFAVSRRTAERLRDAVEAAFGPLLTADVGDNQRHWRLHSTALRQLVRIQPEELAELESAAGRLEREDLDEPARILRGLGSKLRALRRPLPDEAFDEELEALLQTEGLAMRPGPRVRLPARLLSLLRDAIRTRRLVEFEYLSRSTGRRSRQHVEPYGVLYGNRPLLVGRTEWSRSPHLWRLANVSNARTTSDTFERDPGFDLSRYAERSFGTFQETPVDVVLRFTPGSARDAASFLFHPTQVMVENADGSLCVRFTAGGLDEMCWHLFTWSDAVTVEEPAELRERLAAMCASLAAHHGTTSPAR